MRNSPIPALIAAIALTAGWPLTCEGQATDAVLRSLTENRLHVTEGGGRICSVAQLQVSGAEAPIVLASIDWSGRDFCNELWLLNPNSDSGADQNLPAWNVRDVKKLAVTLGAPGEHQLAIPQRYSLYNGAKCIATWTAIYVERDGKLTDDSADYPAFYQDRLRTLQNRLSSSEIEPVCTQMEADKIKRLLGLEPKAGFTLAQSWIQSSDPSLRAKGVAVLGDIGDAPSIQELNRVAATDSPEAALAKHFLRSNSSKK